MDLFRVSIASLLVGFLLLLPPASALGADGKESEVIRVLLEDPALSPETRESLGALLEKYETQASDGWASIREKLELALVPAPFKGMPLAFVTTGLIALAFTGFAGLITL